MEEGCQLVKMRSYRGGTFYGIDNDGNNEGDERHKKMMVANEAENMFCRMKRKMKIVTGKRWREIWCATESDVAIPTPTGPAVIYCREITIITYLLT